MAPGPGADPATWFDRARLAALGVRGPAGGRRQHLEPPLARDQPPGLRRARARGPGLGSLEGAEQARQDSMQAARPPECAARGTRRGHGWRGQERPASRLMAVDIGPNPSVLRQQYPDRSRYLILPALYRAEYVTPVRDIAGNQVDHPDGSRARSPSSFPAPCMCPGRSAIRSSASAPRHPTRRRTTSSR